MSPDDKAGHICNYFGIIASIKTNEPDRPNHIAIFTLSQFYKEYPQRVKHWHTHTTVFLDLIENPIGL